MLKQPCSRKDKEEYGVVGEENPKLKRKEEEKNQGKGKTSSGGRLKISGLPGRCRATLN